MDFQPSKELAIWWRGQPTSASGSSPSISWGFARPTARAFGGKLADCEPVQPSHRFEILDATLLCFVGLGDPAA